jgi:hypothetical protein
LDIIELWALIMGDAKRRKQLNSNYGNPSATSLVFSEAAVQDSLSKIGGEIKTEEQQGALKSLARDKDPENSENWLLSSDDEQIRFKGTLDDALSILVQHFRRRYRKDFSRRVQQARKLSLEKGCIWFFPSQIIMIEHNPVRAAGDPDEDCYFLTLMHNDSARPSPIASR